MGKHSPAMSVGKHEVDPVLGICVRCLGLVDLDRVIGERYDKRRAKWHAVFEELLDGPRL